MAKNREKVETFAERDRKKLVRDTFGNIFAVGCFFCITQPFFNWFAGISISHMTGSAFLSCIAVILSVLYKGLGIYIPFLIFQTASSGRTELYFGKKNPSPLRFCILGVFAALFSGMGVLCVSSLFVEHIRAAGYIITSHCAIGPDSAVSVYTVFIIASALILPFFEEITFRGIIMGSLTDKAGLMSVFVSAFMCACSRISFFEIAPVFVINLIAAWLYYRMRDIRFSYAVNAVSSAGCALIYVLSLIYHEKFTGYLKAFAFIFILIGFAAALIMIFAVRKNTVSPAASDFSRKEKLRGLFFSSLVWAFTVAAVFRLSMCIYKPKPKDEQPGPVPQTEICNTHIIKQRER